MIIISEAGHLPCCEPIKFQLFDYLDGPWKNWVSESCQMVYKTWPNIVLPLSKCMGFAHKGLWGMAYIRKQLRLLWLYLGVFECPLIWLAISKNMKKWWKTIKICFRDNCLKKRSDYIMPIIYYYIFEKLWEIINISIFRLCNHLLFWSVIKYIFIVFSYFFIFLDIANHIKGHSKTPKCQSKLSCFLMYHRFMGYGVQFPVNQVGESIRLWDITGYGLCQVWVKAGLTVVRNLEWYTIFLVFELFLCNFCSTTPPFRILWITCQILSCSASYHSLHIKGIYS